MRLSRVLPILLLLATSHVWAQEDAAGKARALYERGMAHFQLNEYDQAVEKWQEGFRIKPVPEFLYNIGQAYRLSQHPDKAILAYQAFLRMAPKTSNRAEIERHIQNLQAIVEQNQKAATAAPVQPTDQPSTTRPEPAATPPPERPALEQTGSNPSATENALVHEAPRKPLYKKGWFWGAVVGGVVVVAGAVTLGVVLGTRSTVKTLPELNFR
jgi:tetratricopeptide (TPR) repeat protein